MVPITSRNIVAPVEDRDRQKVLGLTDLSCDAWGRQKVGIDHSLFQGIWTFDVDSAQWLEYTDGVNTIFTYFTSENGMLKCQGSTGVSHFLMSKRHPRYQANRGHLYSVSTILPTANNSSIYNYGIFHDNDGVFFRVTTGKIYAVRRTLFNGITQEVVEEILLPTGVDLTKGNVYDIQMQWRGVGNIYFFINQKLVHTMKMLGTLSAISISNPSLPIGFEVIGDGVMYIGCVDITSEGGDSEARQRGAIDSGEITLTTTEVPILLLYLPHTITYSGVAVMNTRDIVLRRISAFSDAATLLRVYTTRTASKFTGTTFTDYNAIASARYAVTPSIVVDNLSTNLSRIITKRISANTSIEIDNPDELQANFYVTHGDYLLITMQSKNSTLGGASVEWGTQI